MNRRSFFKFGAALPVVALPIKTTDVEVPLMCTSDCPHRPERYGINSYGQHVHFVPNDPGHTHTIVGPTHSRNSASIEAVPCTCRRNRREV